MIVIIQIPFIFGIVNCSGGKAAGTFVDWNTNSLHYDPKTVEWFMSIL